MSPTIQTLTSDVIHLIAAGEVIDSLAAVVRELVENALDAGATRITVSLMPELWWIQVVDNGKGMSLRDLRVCASAHSTSKICSLKDLWHITSLGFRGEALHSISQVADLEILSRSSIELDNIGWRVIYQQGKPVAEEAMAIAPGTIVTVSNLFDKFPARRRGLPPLSQQLKSVQAIIQQIALCHPRVTWQIRQNHQPWFNISPGTIARQILPQILKRVCSSDLHYLKLDVATPQEGEIRKIGKAGDAAEEDAERVRRGDAEIKFIKSKSCAEPVALSVSEGLVKERQSECILNSQSQIELVLGLPDRCHRRRADWIKVAVNGRIVRSLPLEQTIIAAMARTLPRDRYPVCFLHLQTSPSQIDWNRHPAKTEIYLHFLPYWQEQISKAIAQALQLDPASLPATVGDRRVGKLLKVAEEKGAYNLSRNLRSPSPVTKAERADDLSLIELQAVAQVNKTYIVAEHPTGLWLIEQHIAHERVLYEQLQDYWELVSLETPIILNNLVPSQLEQLERLSIEIEPFGEDLWAARNAPLMLATREDCADALVELSWGGDLQSAQVATACRSAIRNGTTLSLPEMQNLLDRWKMTRNPRTCPHGRPIYLSLEESSLARFFRRHWVIGKSHGI
ncbi:DNA mismatch repair endonuclease MutL [Pleurocapsales cyanobacterium LEGE 06147]|nr:DNA mismatch repair endonuclease MutL [Pleurocapsales cyanobacterium LEGE 06147]